MNERTTILVADDDAGVAGVVARALQSGGYEILRAASGPEALETAAQRSPDLILLDVHMPGLSGWGVLAQLRQDPVTRTMPVMMLTASAETHDKVEGFWLGANDYVTKPFEVDELRARVYGLLRRHRETLSAHPLTRLPGSPTIQAEIERRIADASSFAAIHADIDRFKAFNDAYGYARGDAAIIATARVLRSALAAAGEADGLLGHVGGDDFVLICSEERAEAVASMAARAFDAQAAGLHDPADAKRGWIERRDRRGNLVKVPLISLTLAGAWTRQRVLDTYAKTVTLADEVKAWLKEQRDGGPSAWAFDRRCDASWRTP